MQPPAYSPTADYSIDIAPGDLGNALDHDFDDIAETTDAILTNLALIQRDDGALGNGTVGPDQFSSTGLLLLAGSWLPRGFWATATAYKVGDVVEQTSVSYVCAVAHTSGVFATDKAAGKWLTLSSTAGAIAFTPTGTISSTNVQNAIAEVSGDVTAVDAALTAHLVDTTDAHAASAIANTPAGNIVATTVQAALNGLDATISALFANKADITTDTVLTNADLNKLKRITATAVVTLPQNSTCTPGKAIRLKSITTGSVTIALNGADTIDGAAGTIRLASYEYIELTPDGVSDWLITVKPGWEVGNVKAHDGSTVPTGWIARGGIVSRSTYAGLFAVAGTTYSAGDGSATFGAGGLTAGRALVGEGTGTVVASGVNADVDTSTDAFVVASNVDKWDHGMAVVFTLASGTITGLTSGNTYYVIRVDATHIKLASTLANAQAGTPAVDLTAKSSPVWTITHTYTARTQGDTFGKESKAMTSTELVAHVHGSSLIQSGAGVSQFSGGAGFPAGNTSSTGGNAAMLTMGPSSVTKYIIKT